jgi:hypothetical protein
LPPRSTSARIGRAEFDYRYNHPVALGYSDIDRTLAAIRGVAGKRLMYQRPD